MSAGTREDSGDMPACPLSTEDSGVPAIATMLVNKKTPNYGELVTPYRRRGAVLIVGLVPVAVTFVTRIHSFRE